MMERSGAAWLPRISMKQRLNSTNVRSAVSSGAPRFTPQAARQKCEPGRQYPAGSKGLFQHLFSPHDPHLGVVDLDAIHDLAYVGLAKRHLAGRQPLAHHPGEAIAGQGIEENF